MVKKNTKGKNMNKLQKLYLRPTNRLAYDIWMKVEKLHRELQIDRRKHKKSSDIERELRRVRAVFEIVRNRRRK